jgi:Domain of unknown function (DUF4214)
MKRSIMLLLAVVLCLGMTQVVLTQKKPRPRICADCDPPPDPCGSNPIDDPTFFVQQQYRDFLFRNPTGSELANDVAPLNSCLLAGDFACYNTARVHMSRTMWDKPEFRQQSRTFGLPLVGDFPFELYNDDDFVALDYWIYLQRAPDNSGYNFWLNNLNSCVSNSSSYFDCPGCSTQCYYDSINAFLSSTEYRSRFGCP